MSSEPLSPVLLGPGLLIVGSVLMVVGAGMLAGRVPTSGRSACVSHAKTVAKATATRDSGSAGASRAPIRMAAATPSAIAMDTTSGAEANRTSASQAIAQTWCPSP